SILQRCNLSYSTYVFFLMSRCAQRSTLFPYTTLFRSVEGQGRGWRQRTEREGGAAYILDNDSWLRYKTNAVRVLPLSLSLPHMRSEEHTSELQSRFDLVCRHLLAKKKRALRLFGFGRL